MTSSCQVTPDWLSKGLKAAFVLTGLCLAGGFNPLFPTGTVQQRHLYRPFLSVKPVVTFFFSTDFSSMSRGAPADHVEQLFTMLLLNTMSVNITLHFGFKTDILYIDTQIEVVH